MARQDRMNPNENTDELPSHLRAQLLWPILAVVVFIIIGLVVLSPWSDETSTESGPNALPTPAQAGTPSP